jgi:hypothetical protein
VSANIGFCRELLRETIDDVKAAAPAVKVSDAWVWSGDRRNWEFHFNGFYWNGSADNAYHARANGWSAWLRAKGHE